MSKIIDLSELKLKFPNISIEMTEIFSYWMYNLKNNYDEFVGQIRDFIEAIQDFIDEKMLDQYENYLEKRQDFISLLEFLNRENDDCRIRMVL